MIRLENFSCGYPGRLVLREVNLEFPAGKHLVVIGENGSGKSTLAQTIAGLKNDFKGKIYIDDLELKRSTPPRKLRRKVGLVLQNPDHQILFNKVEDELYFTLQNLNLPEGADSPVRLSRRNKREHEQILRDKRQEIIREALSKVDLAKKQTANSYELSGGEKQRLALASALMLEPKYLILDEATSMLDLPNRRSVYRILERLKKRGVGIMMMTNSLDEILLADQVLILDGYHIYQHTPAELIQDNSILTRHGLATPLLLKVAKNLGVDNLYELRERL